MQSHDLIVGIDFGTTCTGVSYVNFKRGDSVRSIQKWPGRSSANENKVPTIIVYPRHSPQPSSWGFASESFAERDDSDKEHREWFKTWLDPEILRVVKAKNPQLAPSQAEVDKWYEDYLRFLYGHVKFTLGSALELAPGSVWETSRILFVFSVPTTWGVQTVEKFRSITERAGFGAHPSHTTKLGLTEAEAAAVYASVESPGIFKENDTILICDAGGGTLDLSVLQVTDIASGTLSLRQLVPVVGKRIGSVQIDTDFEKLALKRLQDANYSLRLGMNQKALDEAAWTMMKSREYQNAKCEYGAADDQPVLMVPMAKLEQPIYNEEHGLVGREMRFPESDLRRMFDTQIEKIFQEVDRQLQVFHEKRPGEQIHHLILSGGLGNSPYVQQRLKARYGPGQSTFMNARNMAITVAPEPQLAVSKGLVMDEIRRSKTGKSVMPWRCCRKSYGTVAKVLYDKTNLDHMTKTPDKDPLNGKLYIPQSVVWFVKKVSFGGRGESWITNACSNLRVNLSVRSRQIVHKFSRKLRPGDPSRAFPTDVVESDLDSQFLPSQTNDAATVLMQVKSDLTGVELAKFKKKNMHWWSFLSPAKPYYRVDYQVHMVMGPADISFELWFDGQRMNNPNSIQVDWQESAAPKRKPVPDVAPVYMNGNVRV